MLTIERIDEDEWQPPEDTQEMDYPSANPALYEAWSPDDDTERDILTHSCAKQVAPDAPPPRRGRPVLVGAGIVAAVLVCVGATWEGFEGPESTPTPVDAVEVGLERQADADASSSEQTAKVAAEPPAPEPALSPATRELRIDAAMGRGELERHEAIVFVNLGKHDFRSARAACDALTLAEEDAWRLADLSELDTLVRAKALPRRSYWSGTELDEFGSRALAWHGRYMRASPIAQGWKGAEAVCVLDVPVDSGDR